MLYVSRDSEGRIKEVYPLPIGANSESVAPDAPELLQFIHNRWRENELQVMDREFVRVIEDIVELLIAKNLILFTDLPPAVQQKLLRRRHVRQQTTYPGFLGQGGDDIIPI